MHTLSKLLRSSIWGPVVCLIALGLVLGPVPAEAQSTTFTYQGYLEDGGSPAAGPVDLRFILYDSGSGGSQIGPTITKDDMSLTDGVFAVDLDFGAVFADGARYLEVAVRDGGSTGSYTTLSPREALRPAPTAVTAFSLPNVTVDGSGNVGIGTTSPSSPLTVAGTIESTSGGITFPDGTTQTTAGVGSGSAWQLGGNSGTDPSSGDYLGTADDTPIELRVDGTRAFRIEPAIGSDGNFNPNIIGGHPSNSVSQFVESATISGGGFDNGTEILPNEIGRNFGTIGGGYDNTIDGTGTSATIGGGFRNTASAGFATVGGGRGNTADDDWGTVGGGFSNVASGDAVTVPGGFINAADGDYSFAAGHRAKAQNSGAFVWGDSEDADFASTGADQFLVRAAGGVGIGTNEPFAQFHVQDNLDGAADFFGSHVALLDNESTGTGPDVLALRIGTTGDPGGNANFVTFFDGDKDIVGEIEGNGSGGVSYKSTGADYAELLPTAAPAAAIRPGDIVGVTGGAIAHTTDGAPRLMVVSDNPAVLGNAPDAAEKDWHPVAFVGQVRARVRGPVKVGDLIVASGHQDGTGRAVHPATWNPAEHGPVVGRAWAGKSGAGVGRVNIVVGLDRLGAVMQQLQRQQDRLRSMEDRLARIEAALPAAGVSAQK